MQGHFRGIQNAQHFHEEEAGMDEIEGPSSSVVARMNQSELKRSKHSSLLKFGLIMLLGICLLATILGVVLGRGNSKSAAETGVGPILNDEIDQQDNLGDTATEDFENSDGTGDQTVLVMKRVLSDIHIHPSIHSYL